ncbi:hypothetical protein [Methylocystis sp. ATCC 49242]|uniref:hypothetical protein n=1 Tax=Methylocystis sp. ATCC 49242 TaxID=622637 RepID=UPI0001F86CD1|nr:hypothetical protein [Methylocystis sp. ATCC 49242]
MNPKAEMFIGRLPAGHPVDLADLIPSAFGVVDGFREKARAIRADPTLSKIGADAAVEKALKSGPVAHLSQMKASVDKRLADAVKQRGVLRDRVLKAENFPEARKTEVRTWLRSLPEIERLKLVSSTNDPLISEAVLGAPHYLSGLPQDVWSRAADAAVEAAYSEPLAQIAMLERSYSEARAALQVAADDLRRESGFDTKDFEKLAA